jgi:hypothetical protein
MVNLGPSRSSIWDKLERTISQLQPVSMAAATVQAVDWTNRVVTIALKGDTATAGEVPVLYPYCPRVGDVVWVMSREGAMVVQGPVWGNARTPWVRLTRSVNSSPATGAITAIPFDAPSEDPFGMWNSGNSTRLTFTVPGIWTLNGHGTWNITATAPGRRIVDIRINGTTFVTRSDLPYPTASAPFAQHCGTTRRFAAGDYAELTVFQDTGAALVFQYQAEFSPFLSAVWEGP